MSSGIAAQRPLDAPLGGATAGAQRQHRVATAFGTITAALVLLLALSLGRASLWADEAATGLLMRHDFSWLMQHLATTMDSESAQPLYFVLLWLWTRVAGTSEVALRLPSLLCILAVVPLLERSLRALTVSRPTARIGALSFLALPVVLWYALEARPYALMLLCAALALHESVRLQRDAERSLRAFAWLTVLNALAYAVSGGAALLALGVLALGRWRRSQPRQAVVRGLRPPWQATARGWWAAVQVTAPAALSLLFLFSAFSRSRGVVLPAPRPPLQSIAYALYELVLGRTVGPSVAELRQAAASFPRGLLATAGAAELCIAAVLATALCLVALLALAQLRPRRDRWALPAATPWPGVAVLFTAYAASRQLPLVGRHLLFALPALYLLVVLGLAHATRRRQTATLAIAWVAGAVAVAGLLGDGRYAKDDYRAAARLVRACGFTADQVYLVDAAPGYGFQYYGLSVPTGTLAEGLRFAQERGRAPALLVVNVERLGIERPLLAQWEARTAPSHWQAAGLEALANVPLQGCASGTGGR